MSHSITKAGLYQLLFVGRFTQSTRLRLQSSYSSVICMFLGLYEIKSKMFPDNQEPPVWVMAASAHQKGRGPRGCADFFHQQGSHQPFPPIPFFPSNSFYS